MARGVWLSFGRLSIAGVVALVVCAPLACGSLLGIDNGTPRGDASAVGSTVGDDSAPDVTTSDPPQDAGSRSDVGSSTDGGLGFDGHVGCTPDLNWCDTHCGTGPDNCNQMRACNTPCPTGESCVANVCKCTFDPTWCNGRCQDTTDNCGNPINCMQCDGGVACYSNVCGCMPESVATTCAGKQCGQAINNCNLPVNCGVNNSVNCNPGDYCNESAGTCCTPDNSACTGKCMTSISTCGLTVPCAMCPGNQVCVNYACCTPTTCSAPCVDNCGQSNNACCPPPKDGGPPPPPPDGGACGGPGAPCPTPCCSGLMCGYNFQCVNYCGGQGAQCSQPSDCCYGLSCSGVVVASAAAPNLSGPDSGIVPPIGTCQH
jgi:hypothetical protein